MYSGGKQLFIHVTAMFCVFMLTHVARSNECTHLVDVGLLNLHFLWAGAGGIQEVAVILHHTRGFEETGNIQYGA